MRSSIMPKQKSTLPVQVNQLDSEHQTALMWAAAMGYTGTFVSIRTDVDLDTTMTTSGQLL